MGNGKIRPLWAELIAAVTGVVVVFVAPPRIGWIGTALIALSAVSAIVTLVMSKQPSKIQIIGLIIGAFAVVVGLFVGINAEGEATIFSPALIWLVGAGLMMSTLFTLVTGNIKKNLDDPHKISGA